MIQEEKEHCKTYNFKKIVLIHKAVYHYKELKGAITKSGKYITSKNKLNNSVLFVFVFPWIGCLC